MTLFLWDASHYDGTLTRAILAKAKAEGIIGFTHKIGEGLADTEGTHDDTALAAARDVGMELVGGYWVVRTAPSMADQVDALVRLADQGEPWWRDFPGWAWQTDLERWSYDSVSAAKGIDFARRLRDKTKRQVFLYASHGQYPNQLTGWDGPLWNADYVSRPVGSVASMYPGDNWKPVHPGGWVGGWATYSGQEPTFLQHTSSATIAELTTCDGSGYRGNLAQLRSLLGIKSTPAPKEDKMLSMATVKVDSQTEWYIGDGIWYTKIVTWPEHNERLAQGADEKFFNKDDDWKSHTGRNLVDKLPESSPPVTVTMDPATLAAAFKLALQDPDVLAATAKAVNDDLHSRTEK